MSVVSNRYRVAGVPLTTVDKAAKPTTAAKTMESLKFITARYSDLIDVNGTDEKRGLSRRRKLQLKLGLSISTYLIYMIRRCGLNDSSSFPRFRKARIFETV